MLKAFLALFEEAQHEDKTEHTIELATAALLSEVIRADNQIDEQEIAQFKRQLNQHFSLSDEELNALVSHGQSEAEQAVDLIQFTSVVNEKMGANERVRILKSMWEIAMADGNIDKFEEHTIRKVADLMHIPHSQYIKTKLSVTEN
jgi:uncharacterized tellurite resistance protein B-like protein